MEPNGFFKTCPQGSVQWTNLHFVFQAILFCLSQRVDGTDLSYFKPSVWEQ